MTAFKVESLAEKNASVPGGRQQEYGNNWTGATLAAIFLAVFVPQLVSLRHPYFLHIISVLVVAFLGDRAASAHGRGWWELRRDYLSLKTYYERGLQENQRYKDFVTTFPVDVERAGSILKADAMLVNSAHRAKVNFYREYRGFNSHETSGDPEEAAAKLQQQFAQVEAELERHVREALAEFRRKKDLAKWQFSVRDSWKDYVGIQKTDTGGVEGRNEPPSQ